jgi:hypothetical protein
MFRVATVPAFTSDVETSGRSNAQAGRFAMGTLLLLIFQCLLRPGIRFDVE